jgi:hypothetical protein
MEEGKNLCRIRCRVCHEFFNEILTPGSYEWLYFRCEECKKNESTNCN